MSDRIGTFLYARSGRRGGGPGGEPRLSCVLSCSVDLKLAYRGELTTSLGTGAGREGGGGDWLFAFLSMLLPLRWGGGDSEIDTLSEAERGRLRLGEAERLALSIGLLRLDRRGGGLGLRLYEADLLLRLPSASEVSSELYRPLLEEERGRGSPRADRD